MSYEGRRHPDLPWGHWLHARGDGLNVLVDEEGRQWGSVRQAFHEGRLGLPQSSECNRDRDLERLLAVLAAVSRRVVSIAESERDLFRSDSDFSWHYRRWLIGLGLVEETTGTLRDWSPLTIEGRAALLMLVATRPAGLAHVPMGTEGMNAFKPAMTDVERERWLAEVDEVVRRRRFPHRFQRDEIWNRPAVTLVGFDTDAAMPLMRTFWSQLFADTGSRDAFHAWLCERLDRWCGWAEIAKRKGAPALTSHLLEMVAGAMQTTTVGTETAAPSPNVIALPDLAAGRR